MRTIGEGMPVTAPEELLGFYSLTIDVPGVGVEPADGVGVGIEEGAIDRMAPAIWVGLVVALGMDTVTLGDDGAWKGAPFGIKRLLLFNRAEAISEGHRMSPGGHLIQH